MRRTCIEFLAFVAISLLFLTWEEWKAYRGGIVDDTPLMTHALFTACVIVICIRRLIVNRKSASSLIYIAILCSLAVPRAFPYWVEFAKMKVRAEVFSQQPDLCQTRSPEPQRDYVCYHYYFSFALGPSGPDNWLVFDPEGKLSWPPAQWPEHIKRLFVGTQTKEILQSFDCMFSDVSRMTDHVYWVTTGCSGSSMR